MLSQSQFCCTSLYMLYSILVPHVVCVSAPYVELHEHAYYIPIVLVIVRECIVYQHSKYWSIVRFLRFYFCTKFAYISPQYVSYMNVHLSIVLCCGTRRVLQIIKYVGVKSTFYKVLCLKVVRLLNMHVVS